MEAAALLTDREGRPVYFGQLVASALRVLRSGEDAEDAASDVVAEALATGRTDRPLLIFAARRRAIDLRRKAATRRELPWDTQWERPRPPSGPPPSPERLAALHDAIRALPPRQALAVRLRFFEGLSEPEAAREMGCTKQGVGSNVRKALDNLRKRLSPQTQENGR